jgi:hypothetical protein
MNLARPRRIVLLGMMTRHPVAGVVWQNLHYLLGFQRLGFDAYYVEAGAHQPSSMLPGSDDDDYRSTAAASFISAVMERFDLGDHWAFHALHEDDRCYGLSEAELNGLYASADLIVNLHGATMPRREHFATDRLIYLETDPVALQIELHQHLRETIDFLSPHRAFFTFGENYGQPDCLLPVTDRFCFHPTRQPVVVDLWQGCRTRAHERFTTVGNWQQMWREVDLDGETYGWSKHQEFLKFLDLPSRVGERFELALSRCDEPDRQMLEANGWRVRDALSFSTDLDAYRDYIARSHGEFTVAKDQNVRLRSGWFSDRSATYLAAGRPVINQETGFSNILPTGDGLFAFQTIEDVVAAIERIDSDYEGQCRAAREVARAYFSHDVVLGKLVADVGL